MTDRAIPRPPGLSGLLYGIYAWLVFIVCALFALLFTLLVPGLERRRRWVSASARLPFSLAGIDVNLCGSEKLPPSECVVVANHASYIDGVLLQAFLPPRFSYVIKGEVQKVPVLGFLLRRIGSKFVERFDTSASARDAINADVPLVPLVITGSRHILPAETVLPRHGHLRIDILTPLDHSEPAYAKSRTLATLARERMLEVLDEPDLLTGEVE
jgi:1-acyl-sn-glycerol-3-phosphate acyltransferase